MATDKTRPQPAPAPTEFQEAMTALSAGDLSGAVRRMLEIHRENLESEEAYFVERQLARVKRLWPAEAEKAGLDAAAWGALKERAAKRREGRRPPREAMAVIGLLVAVGAWALLVAVAPRTAFLGRVEVPVLFRIVGAAVGVYSLGTAFGLLKMKWEAVNLFLVLSPILLIVTFIGLAEAWEAGDLLAKGICGVALLAEAAAAWYMSKNSHLFVY